MIGTDDGLLIFHSNYQPPRNRGPTEVKKKAFVYVHTIKRKLCILGRERNKYITTWSKMYEQLVAYEQQHGHCNVSATLGDKKKLGAWVSKQRNQFKNQVKGYKENEERYIALNEIGFIFNLKGQAWPTMYEKLVIYKQQRGDCNVSDSRKGDNKKLGRATEYYHQSLPNERPQEQHHQ